MGITSPDPTNGATGVGGAANDNPYQFTGREDDGAGLENYRARYYAPGYGQFLSQDPLGLGGGDYNLYRYAGGDPINRRDPTGKQGIEAFNNFVHYTHPACMPPPAPPPKDRCTKDNPRGDPGPQMSKASATSPEQSCVNDGDLSEAGEPIENGEE